MLAKILMFCLLVSLAGTSSVWAQAKHQLVMVHDGTEWQLGLGSAMETRRPISFLGYRTFRLAGHIQYGLEENGQAGFLSLQSGSYLGNLAYTMSYTLGNMRTDDAAASFQAPLSLSLDGEIMHKKDSLFPGVRAEVQLPLNEGVQSFDLFPFVEVRSLINWRIGMGLTNENVYASVGLRSADIMSLTLKHDGSAWSVASKVELPQTSHVKLGWHMQPGTAQGMLYVDF